MRITVDMALPSHSSSGKMQRRRIRLARDKNDREEQERCSSVTSIIPVIPATAQSSARAHASPGRAIAIIRHFPISAGLPPRSLAMKPRFFEKEDRSTIEIETIEQSLIDRFSKRSDDDWRMEASALLVILLSLSLREFFSATHFIRHYLPIKLKISRLKFRSALKNALISKCLWSIKGTDICLETDIE